MSSKRIPPGTSASGRLRFLPVLLPLLLLLVAGAPGARAADEPVRTRWYESLRDGKKVAWSSVTWSVSTWEGKPTIHDRTEIVRRTTRDMAGHLDVFQERTLIDLERGDDGTLWWLKIETVESGRRSKDEVTWTGSGYVSVSSVDDQEKKTVVPLDRPVMADAEAFLSRRAREGTLTTGEKLPLRELDVEGRRADVREIEVLGPEEVAGESGPVAAVKVVIRHPKTGSEEWMWMDREGAYVRSLSDAGSEQRRVTREQAQTMPRRAPSFSITSPSLPPLERVMSADRLWVDVRLRADADRKLPAFPVSPWSRAEPAQNTGDGWRIPAVLTSYDRPPPPAGWSTLPLDPKGFERELESTPLMPCDHPDLEEAARDAVGNVTNARTAAERLARWVHDKLTKGSPDVAEASALQILAERKGDCSEHALLFVALCRTVGIPARRCSGWVNIGSDWGSHAWAEIWLGAWVGADPTTGEVGTAARYLFFGYQDDPDSFPGVVSSRISGRISLEATRIEEDGVAFDLSPRGSNVKESGDGPERWWLHVPSGIEGRALPEGWSMRLKRGDDGVQVRGPGITASVSANADQGLLLERMERMEVERTTFAGAPAVSVDPGTGRRWIVHSRRRLVDVQTGTQDAAKIALLEQVLAPTFAERVTDPAKVEPAAYLGTWTLDVEGSLHLLQQRLMDGLVSGGDQSALLERHARLLQRVPVTLRLEEGGVAELTFAREAAGSPAPQAATRRGTWAVAEGKVAVHVPEAVEGAAQGEVALTQRGKRLQLTWGAWTLLLQKDPAGK